MATVSRVHRLGTRELQTLLTSGQLITQQQAPEDICNRAGEAAAFLLGAPFTALALVSGRSAGAVPACCAMRDGFQKPSTTDLARLDAMEWSPIASIKGGAATLPEAQVPLGLTRQGISHLLRLPLCTDRGKIGALLVGRGKPWRPTAREMVVLTTLGTQAAVALHNARSLREAREMALFAELTTSPVLRFDTEGTVISANPAVMAALGERAAEGVSMGYLFPGLADLDWARLIREGLLVDRDVTVRGRRFHFVIRGLADLGSGHACGSDVTQHRQMEEALRETSATLRSLIHASPLAIIILDSDLNVRVWNQAAERIFGWSEEEVFARQWPLFPEGIGDELERMLRDAPLGYLTRGGDVSCPRKDGSQVDVRVWGTRLSDDRGDGMGTLLVVDDITERKRTEERVRLQVAALESTANAIMIADRKGTIIWVNPAFTAMTGYEAEEAVGHNPRLLKSGKQAPRFYKELWDTILSGRVWRSELINRKKNGSLYVEAETITPVRSDGGEITHFVAIKQDITERKRAEEAQAVTRKTLDGVFRSAPVAIFTLDPSGTVTTWNPAAERMFGWSEREIIGQPYPLVPEERSSEFQQHWEMVTKGVALVGVETRRQRKDGTQVHVSLSTAALLSSGENGGDFMGVVAIMADISEIKQAEEMLLQRTRELTVLEERNRIAAEIHDTLAQGLTGISLSLEAAELALQENPSAVLERVRSAKNIVRESLTEVRRSVWNLMPITLEGRPLERALEEEVCRFSAVGRGKAFFTLSGERRQLSQEVQVALLRVCQEALTNARRHARCTRAQVVLSFHPHAVQLTVTDNGKGFDVDAVRASGNGGNLGLSGMERRVQSVGGKFTVRSKEGEGTQLKVWIPLP